MRSKLILALAASIGLSACSTIVNGSNQSIKVNTGEVTGANCTATGGSEFAVNETFVTPAELKIPRSKKALKIECNKAGFQTATQTVNGKVEGTTAGNLLIGGGIGVGVDALTGAIYTYPGTVSLTLVPLASGSLSDSAPITR